MQIVRLTETEALSAVHAALIVPHFPPEERSAVDTFVTATLKGQQVVWAARSHGAWVGCAVIERFEVESMVLLDWLAVVPALRSTGLGAALVRTVLDHLPTLGASLIIAEIEDPRGSCLDGLRGDPGRRAAFYTALGAKAILVPHWQPPMDPGLPAVPLLLIAMAREPLGDLLPSEPLRAALQEYAGREPTWPAVARALAAPTVRLVPISGEAFVRSRSMTSDGQSAS